MPKPNAIEQQAINALAMHGAPHEELRILRTMIETMYPGAISRAKERIDKARFDKMFKGKVPDWLRAMVKKHAPNALSVTIRHSKIKPGTSGHCRGRHIIITFGAAEAEHRLVALHEIAHVNAGFGIEGPHGERFYRELRRLLVAENMLRQYVSVIGGAAALRKAGRE